MPAYLQFEKEEQEFESQKEDIMSKVSTKVETYLGAIHPGCSIDTHKDFVLNDRIPSDVNVAASSMSWLCLDFSWRRFQAQF